MSERVLLLGCGSSRDRRIKIQGKKDWEGQELVTLDSNPSHSPDIVWDLDQYPWKWTKGLKEGSQFDEIHAYEVLEHLGEQGYAESFFGCFFEIWRLLKPGGYLAATVPHWQSMWATGSP